MDIIPILILQLSSYYLHSIVNIINTIVTYEIISFLWQFRPTTCPARSGCDVLGPVDPTRVHVQTQD